MDHRGRLKELLVERSVRTGDYTLASGVRSSYYVDARRTTMGADPVAYAIAHRSWLNGHPPDAFSVRKKAKEHGTAQRVEGGVPPGAHCMVVEDSMTSGASALAAAAALRDHGTVVTGVFTLVDRLEGGRERLATEALTLLAAFAGPELLEAARARGARMP